MTILQESWDAHLLAKYWFRWWTSLLRSNWVATAWSGSPTAGLKIWQRSFWANLVGESQWRWVLVISWCFAGGCWFASWSVSQCFWWLFCEVPLRKGSAPRLQSPCPQMELLHGKTWAVQRAVQWRQAWPDWVWRIPGPRFPVLVEPKHKNTFK